MELGSPSVSAKRRRVLKESKDSVVTAALAVSPEPAVQASTFAERALRFFSTLDFPAELAAKLPPDVAVMNPYKESPEALRVMGVYLNKFFNDSAPRAYCFGINPGRHGGGLTGVPFTSPDLLKEKLGIESSLVGQQEFSGQYVYRFIEAYCQTPEKFFARHYITSLCPLGFLQKSKSGVWKNFNFYDNLTVVVNGKKVVLFDIVKDYMIKCIKAQKEFGCSSTAICLGTGQNLKVFRQLNSDHDLFDEITAVEHPRFILQYKRSQVDTYINRWKAAFDAAAATLPPPLELKSEEKP